MARKKKTNKGNGFNFFSKKKKDARSKKDAASSPSGIKIAAGIIAATILIAGGAIGFIYLEGYVKTTLPPEDAAGPLAYAKLPAWVNQQWKDSIYKVVGEGPFPLNDESAKKIAEQLENIAWLSNVKTQVTPEFIMVQADYRRPVGLVVLSENQKYYLDEQMVVLDYLPLDTLPIVEIKGISSPRSIPAPGIRWAVKDADAGVYLINLLYINDMDRIKNGSIKRPLLDEIESIDVSNFAARKNNKDPHIVLNVKDGITQVNWGAAWGQAARYLEKNEIAKLTALYKYYTDNNSTLQGTAKYIELRQL